MQDFQNLKVWKRAHKMTLELYRATRSFPKDELYGLTSQIRQASASIGANLAEGCGRGSDSDFARFAQMAMSSACEVEYHLIMARDLEFITTKESEHFLFEVRGIKRMLTALLETLKAESREPKAESARAGKS
jgi:four helix bundle protein